jgi:arsenate reductase
MKKVTIYEKPTCTTCRKTIKLLNELGVPFENINYFLDPFTKESLSNILKKMNMLPSDILRKNEDAYRKLEFRKNNYTEEEILEFMINDHNLIQRPIIEIGNKAILARPVEKIKELL